MAVKIEIPKKLVKKVQLVRGSKSAEKAVKKALEEWLTQQPRSWEDNEPTWSPYIELIESPIHGTGVRAAKDIPAGTRVIEYVGERLTKKQADKRWEEHCTLVEHDPNLGDVYLFQLNAKYDIDGNVPWNTARFINHSCDPNCETDVIKGHIWILALRDIKKGEELSYNYGYGWEEFEDHECRCGTDCCVGYILDQDLWPRLFRKLRKETRLVKAVKTLTEIHSGH